jgi:hypothetical protein
VAATSAAQISNGCPRGGKGKAMSNASSSVARIAEAYSVLSRSDAGARWRWANQILKLRDGQPEKKRGVLDKEIGAECAKAVGRDKPYSPQWVRAYVNAARQFQSQPTTPKEAEQFLALCNNAQTPAAAADGNGEKGGGENSEKSEKGGGTIADAFRMLASAVKLAQKRGATEVEIQNAVNTLLNGKAAA